MSDQYFAPPIKIDAQMTLEDDNVTRYQFKLRGYEGETSRTFIIDVPPTAIGTTDVWVVDSIVAVGDDPKDGFATYSPADTTDPEYREHHDGIITPEWERELLSGDAAKIDTPTESDDKLVTNGGDEVQGEVFTIGTGKDAVKVISE